MLAAVLVAGWLLWPGGGENEPTEPAEPPADEAPAEDPYAAFFEAAADRPLEEAPAAEGPSDLEGRRAAWREKMRSMTEEERRAWREQRRERWREKMRNMTPEERRAFFRRFIEITPMGDEDPGLEPEQVAEALRATRPAVRDCVRANGGFRAFRDAMRQAAPADGGARRRLSISFDLTPEGAIPDDSIAIDPAPPEPFYSCFADALASAQLPQPQADARIEMRMGGHHGRRGPRRDGPPPEQDRGERR